MLDIERGRGVELMNPMSAELRAPARVRRATPRPVATLGVVVLPNTVGSALSSSGRAPERATAPPRASMKRTPRRSSVLTMGCDR